MSSQSKMKNRWPFTKKEQNTESVTPSRHMQTTIPSAKWYHRITELPLSRFVDCLVDDTIYALVLSGKPTDEELNAAWVSIQGEYAEAIGNHEYRLDRKS